MSIFCSIIKLCINKDNLLVPYSLSNEKIFKNLSGLNSKLVYQANGFLFTPEVTNYFFKQISAGGGEIYG